MQDHIIAHLAFDFAFRVDLLGPLRKKAPECNSASVNSSTLLSALFGGFVAAFLPPFVIFWATPRVATLALGRDDASTGISGEGRPLWFVAAAPLICLSQPCQPEEQRVANTLMPTSPPCSERLDGTVDRAERVEEGLLLGTSLSDLHGLSGGVSGMFTWMLSTGDWALFRSLIMQAPSSLSVCSDAMASRVLAAGLLSW